MLEWVFATLTVLTEAATGNLYYDPAQYQQSGDIADDSMDRKDSGIVVSDHDEQEPNDHDYEHEGMIVQVFFIITTNYFLNTKVMTSSVTKTLMRAPPCRKLNRNRAITSCTCTA